MNVGTRPPPGAARYHSEVNAMPPSSSDELLPHTMSDPEADIIEILKYLLATGPNPLVVETPDNVLRSSCQSSCWYFRDAQMRDLVAYLRNKLGLSAGERKPVSAQVRVGWRSVRLNYCPQFDGDIFVLHRPK